MRSCIILSILFSWVQALKFAAVHFLTHRRLLLTQVFGKRSCMMRSCRMWGCRMRSCCMSSCIILIIHVIRPHALKFATLQLLTETQLAMGRIGRGILRISRTRRRIMFMLNPWGVLRQLLLKKRRLLLNQMMLYCTQLLWIILCTQFLWIILECKGKVEAPRRCRWHPRKPTESAKSTSVKITVLLLPGSVQMSCRATDLSVKLPGTGPVPMAMQ
ncbi:unnamed protein product [Prorocentrum cordatum]|uniref:Secreted protein n=1 Tax=Prorocentrum cordatum TaxID=2364126 RepID=A0ABN9Q125_9DINO|nr:unnamed protein product [Polarella glacialis]